MNCPRCDRTMTLKKFYDYGGYAWAWKCVFCGEMIELPQKKFLWPEEEVSKTLQGKQPLCDDL
jgi:hypothetical protein